MPDTLLIDLLGRRLTLLQPAWFGHILKRHADMARWRTWVEATMRHPAVIHQSPSAHHVKIYYRHPDPRGIMIAVVGDHKQHIVLAAYRTRKKIGRPEWPLPSRHEHSRDY